MGPPEAALSFYSYLIYHKADMKKYEILESKDGRCPYCLSEFVLQVSGEEEAKILERLPIGEYKIYKCYTCNKYFFMRP